MLGLWILILLNMVHRTIANAATQLNQSLGAQSSANTCANLNDFPCRICTNVCIPREKWQDGQVDCPDGSDEECLEWQFDCKFGNPRCISQHNVMDGIIDCSSGFDEDCPAHFFICSDRSDCIDPKKYLDGNKDCADGSDEPCPLASFFCRDKLKCVPVTSFQDGRVDCKDASDEECMLFQLECRCGSRRCVDIRAFNDSKLDCEDGSDEPGHFIEPEHKCPDGTEPRRVLRPEIKGATPPPGAPLMPCSPDDAKRCDDGANEMCIMLAGVPHCVCKFGTIKPPGLSRCIPALLSTHQTESLVQTTPRFLFNKDNLTSEALPVIKTNSSEIKSLTCNLQDTHSCPGQHEVCAKTDGQFACVCDAGFSRHPNTGICTEMLNECSDNSLNDCDPNAICMDNPVSYECLCKEGFLDMSLNPQITPGRHCVPLINECRDNKANDCDFNADCLDLPKGFTCRCKEGYLDASFNPNKAPGRKCVKSKNECSNQKENDCSPFSYCIDLSDGYKCTCKDGYVDATPDKSGRLCRAVINECLNDSLNDCDKNFGRCIDTLDSYICKCRLGYVDLDATKSGTKCAFSAAQNPCLDSSLNDCDSNAACTSSGPGIFECLCPSGFADVSPPGNRRPGRLCRQLVDECTLGTHRCDPNAICTDTPESYTCKCSEGWKDVSPDQSKVSGRQCEKAQSACSSKNLNDCSPLAVCQETTGDGGFVCQCNAGTFDASAVVGRAPGRDCRPLRDECADRSADCAPDTSDCIDTPDAYLCRCRDGYSDMSSDPVNRPGRKCDKSANTKAVSECDVNDPLACHKDLFEVCTFVNGTYRCLCPKDVSRLPDGRCKIVNECLETRLNDCHRNSQCIDTAELYSCQCKPGFADLSQDKIHKPGRLCQELVNECNEPKKFGVDCDQNAICVDIESSYACRCKAGFADVSEEYGKLPGRKCVVAVNECLNASLHRCSPNAVCLDAKEGYVCRCRETFVDASPNVTHYPGRVCHKPPTPQLAGANRSTNIVDERFGSTSLFTALSTDECDPNASKSCARSHEVCSSHTDESGSQRFFCFCARSAAMIEDGTCKVLNACDNRETHDCDGNAICSNVFDSYECQCKPQFLDMSPDPTKKGRKCKELTNECADPSTNDCSVFASCIDTRESFACVCRNGYVDVSAQFSLPPGRKCQNTSNECSVRTLNTCDDNADCVDTAEGYTCQCAPGFVDVSTSASLPPGRVCTVQTYCPTQLTDLVFLVDGSGSIGSFVFKNEVLRFVRDFVALFDVGPNQTRVGMIQFSDQIRHEFELGTHNNKHDVEAAVSQVAYLTGLTRTGAAIKDMVDIAFTERRGARPMSSGVHRVAIVITDGRSQDTVSEPALDARRANVLLFAVGVTDHVLESELVQIAGSRQRTFVVEQFTDLNTRLRSLIQKALCPPAAPVTPTKTPGCDPGNLDSCDRTRNEICKRAGQSHVCGCPDAFERHPKTGVCGGDLCNFQLKTSCPDPELCQKTFYGTFRCACPPDYFRLHPSGVCYSSSISPPQPQTPAPKLVCRVDDPSSCGVNEVCISLGIRLECQCKAGLVRQPITNECAVPGACDPKNPANCDSRRREVCLPDGLGNSVCQCPPKFERHPVTQICLRDECKTNTHDCDKNAICTDTAEGYICQCPDGYLDRSKEPEKPGRDCQPISFSTDVCDPSKTECSTDSVCIPLAVGYTCQCKPDFVDFSPNPQRQSGIVCKPKENECLNGKANCHKDATCIDTDESYICVCKPGFVDKLGLTNPGRQCELFVVNNRCEKGNNDCDPNARCIPQGSNNYVCVCPTGYKDKSPNMQSNPGRLCIPLIPECDNPTLNDCDSNAHCFEQEDGYTCACKAEFVDISPDANKSGRLCKKLVDECFNKLDDCALDTEGGICEDTADSYACRCRPGFTDLSPDPVHRPGRVCRPIRNKCNEGLHDCSPNAHCIETGDSFTCLCMPGFYDVSTNPVNRPGRSCLRLINECESSTLNDCSPNAFCNDTIQSYRCQCKSGFVDESSDLLNRPGRICRPKHVNECQLNISDCSVNADCINLDDGFQCQCREGFLDESPNRVTLPGRVCVAKPPPTPKPECQIESIHSCNVNINEVCRMVDGEPKCVCPERFQRNSQTNACSIINECQYFELNDCSQNADCQDEADGYTCRCKQNFRDRSPSQNRPGRVCQPIIDECQFPHLNDCHQNAICTSSGSGFSCRCREGFMDLSPDPINRPGRVCHRNVNECADPTLNSCDHSAVCTDQPFGYSCQCQSGFIDISPTPTTPGRACKRIVDECLNRKDNDCDPIATCTDTLDSYICDCPANSTDISRNQAFPGRVCHIDVDVCRVNLHDCDKNAICRNKGSSFVCDCAVGFIDRSPNPLRPGRVCIALVNECNDRSATCSPNAECRDLEDGYTCTCKSGFVDRSPVRSQPGRVCTRPEICQSNHDCSSAAICEPTDNGAYTCRCIPGYDDQSPNDKPGRVCVRGDKCRDARLNNCSANAVCVSLAQGYRCECVDGFVDKSPDFKSQPGRLCELDQPPIIIKKHPCQDPSLNDCSLSGVCRSLNDESFTCECRPNFIDRSPDPIRQPGRVCIPKPPVCFDSTQNDCHPFSICEQTDDSGRFKCRCRDGYVDTSPDKQKLGRICREKINECLDASKNDCAPDAICEDLDLGYNCKCPPTFKDVSPDSQKPGRRCVALLNECQLPHVNNCSRFADCFDQEDGYRCQCKDGYFDNNNAPPGRQCALVINECEFPNLNECDRQATCTDLPGGYSCRCPEPFVDHSPDPARAPGRVCLLNECEHPNLNDCHAHAVCQDTADSFVCHCELGYVDLSIDPRKPGRNCDKQSLTLSPALLATTPNPDVIPCGLTRFCLLSLNERCAGGIRCECPPATGRRAPGQRCSPVVGFALPLRVLRRQETPLSWTSAFGNPNDAAYVEIVDAFDFGISQAMNTTSMAPVFVYAATDAITHPRLYNASWNDGLLFNFTLYFTPGSVHALDVWRQLIQTVHSNDYEIGRSGLYIDAYQLDPFAPPLQPLPPCGDGNSCDPSLGEVCVGGRVCACPSGKGRRTLGTPCVNVVGFTLPLWVIRRNEQVFHYNKSFVDTNSAFYKQLVDMFHSGCQQAFNRTIVWPYYVNNEVLDLVDPQHFNGSWDRGCMFNFTVYVDRAATTTGGLDARRCYNELVQSCQSTGYSLGGSELFINDLQPNPFSPCFKSDCHVRSVCIERGPNSYTCSCPGNYRDLDPNKPGRRCIAQDEFDECQNPSDNDCSPNADCIDLPHLYRCECKSNFVDISPADGPKGRVCDFDYCLDVPFCPQNTSCVNVPEIQGARCQCHPGFLDIKPSAKRLRLYGENVFCLAAKDVNECDLELTNCSSVATCTNLDDGYTCSCPAGYTDANPSLPGRICAGASCGLCNGHGDCLPVTGSREVKCRCHNWYTGEFCDKDMRVILVIIFAVIFLLLALCFLLYFCLKCRCVRNRSSWHQHGADLFRGGKGQQHWPWNTLHGSSSSESGAGMSVSGAGKGSAGADLFSPGGDQLAIPRAKLHGRELMAADRLMGYLDTESNADSATAIRIPRARLDVAATLERNGSGSLAFSDAAPRRRRAAAYSDSDDMSTSSGDSTTAEEVQRRVTTDVRRTTETSRVTTAQVHNAATAQFRVYPPVAGRAARSIYEAFSGLKKLGRSSSDKEKAKVTLDKQASQTHESRYNTTNSEKDRGQSIAEFSVSGLPTGAVAASSDWGRANSDTYGVYSQPGAVSEYTERDLESISEESMLSASSNGVRQALNDKTVLVASTANSEGH